MASVSLNVAGPKATALGEMAQFITAISHTQSTVTQGHHFVFFGQCCQVTK